ncbi:Wzz/FepE/Etk N-terminal domain-containing protein [Phytomonospora sp. NPDC050363]|uniref:Wzz/FepE/Etk N-terminal domain-containing protein n=1 Tax=Phytomonospora sp. NPDC050363 TaxID=3155642 RepID=UPI0033D511AB
MLVAMRRGRWLLLALLTTGLLAGAAVAFASPKVYESRAQVLVRPTGVDAVNVEGGRTKSELNLDTEAQLVRSTEVAALARDLLGASGDPGRLSSRVTVEVPANTSVLTIGFAGDTAAQARDGAAAFATAYLSHREDSAREVIETEAATVDAGLEDLRGQLTEVSAQLAGADPRDPQKPVLTTNRDLLQTQIEDLASRRSDLDNRLSTLAGGRVISEAALPEAPSSPIVWLDLAGGGTAGLLLGFGAVVARERFSRRVRRAADLPERCGVPLLGELPASVAPRFADVYGAYGPPGKLFGRLRNELTAALPGNGRVLLVVSIDPGPAATVVAANLAAAFARADRPTAVVAAHASPFLALPDLLGTPSVPGLAEVITGRADLDEVANRAARHPHLTVIGAGSAARASGWPTGTMRQLVGALSQSAELVVVESPPAAGGDDAQRLAGSADAVLLVVESERTRLGAVIDFAEQLRRVNTPLLGAVVLPRVRPPAVAPVEVPTVQASRKAIAKAPAASAPELRFDGGKPVEGATEILPVVPGGTPVPARSDSAAEKKPGPRPRRSPSADGRPCQRG